MRFPNSETPAARGLDKAGGTRTSPSISVPLNLRLKKTGEDDY